MNFNSKALLFSSNVNKFAANSVTKNEVSSIILNIFLITHPHQVAFAINELISLEVLFSNKHLTIFVEMKHLTIVQDYIFSFFLFVIV